LAFLGVCADWRIFSTAYVKINNPKLLSAPLNQAPRQRRITTITRDAEISAKPCSAVASSQQTGLEKLFDAFVECEDRHFAALGDFQ